MNCVALHLHTVGKNKSQYYNFYTIGNQNDDAASCDAAAESVDFGLTFTNRTENLTGGCKTGTRMHKRQRVQYFQQGMHGYISYCFSSYVCICTVFYRNERA